MKRFFALFAIIVFIFLSLINCSEDEVTNPDNGGNAPTVIITNPADRESFILGDIITFTGSGEDQGGTSLPDSMLVWTSDHDNTIGVGTSFANDTLTINTHIITLTGKISFTVSDHKNLLRQKFLADYHVLLASAIVTI